jgi:hypothetical protein
VRGRRGAYDRSAVAVRAHVGGLDGWVTFVSSDQAVVSPHHDSFISYLTILFIAHVHFLPMEPFCRSAGGAVHLSPGVLEPFAFLE